MNDINKFKESLIKDLYDLSVNCDITLEELADDICDDCRIFYNQALDDCRKLCGTDRPNYTDCSNCMFAHFENDFDTTICKLEQLKK